ncbi:MAG: HEAT repeat domain-containing protein [Polyangiaceae bacterium]
MVLVIAAGCKGEPKKGANASNTPDRQLDSYLGELSACPLASGGLRVDSACPEAVHLVDFGNANRAWIDGNPLKIAKIGEKHLDSPSVSVRVEAVSWIGRTVAANERSRTVLVELAKTEKDAAVLTAIARAAGRARVAMAPLLETLARGSEPKVRREAISSWVDPSASPEAELRGPIAAFVADSTAPLDARRRACERIRVGEDAALLEAVSGLLDADATPRELFASCFYGLTLSFAGGVKPPSEGSYNKVIGCLESCPRSGRYDTSLGLVVLDAIFTGKPDAAPPSFVDRARVERAAVAIAKDAAATADLRAAALGVLGDPMTATAKTGLSLSEIQAITASAAASPQPSNPE